MKVAVVGTGIFGQNHLRVIGQSRRAELVAAVDADASRAQKAATDFNCAALTDWRELAGKVDAAVVATPTVTHAEIGCGLMEAGIAVLVEKPIAADVDSAQRLCDTAVRTGKVLQIGQLERFNPAIIALSKLAKLPLFFEVHRMSVFAPRSLDVDVVLDLMIHDLDIILEFAGAMPEEVRAAGIRILSEKVDIANVRLAFPGGCVANLTASRASTEKVRKLRVFQPHQYISIDYARQDGVVINVGDDRQIGFQPLPVFKKEPLAAQFDAFLDAIEGYAPVVVPGTAGLRALTVALEIARKIEEHGKVVTETIRTSNI